MSNIKHGLTSWDDIELGGNKVNFKKQKDLYLRLDNGSNVVRIVTRPHQYLQHNFKEEGDTGYGDKIMCSSFHKSCPLCEKGDKPKQRWLVGVIDRKTQSYKILDMSVTVLKNIQDLSRDEDYGDPSRYDIDIKVDKNGGATGYYTVIPKPPKPLSQADVELKSKADLEDLARRCQPPTPEQAQQRLDTVRARKAQKAGAPVQSKVNPVPSPAMGRDAASSEDDDDYTFTPAKV